MVGRSELVGHRPDAASAWNDADALFPVRVTRSFWNRVNPTDPADPLALQVLPHPAELADDPEGLLDPVGDAACASVPWVVHKYPDRVLLLVTKRCHLYCRYCFRRTYDPAEAESPTPDEIEAALAYTIDSGAREVILSGGDPLTLKDAELGAILTRLTRAPSVKVVRVHSRAPITAPWRVTPALVEMMRSHAPLWVVVHCNHPRELSAEVDDALARLVDAGIPVLNQAVLLRGVNDAADVLAELCESLVERRVRPYYLHATDRVRGNQHFRVPHAEGLALMDELRQRVSGVALPRYVVDPPEGSGKLDVSSWLARQT